MADRASRKARIPRDRHMGGGSGQGRVAPAVGVVDISHGVALYLEEVDVVFDGFKAINGLNFYLDAGELRCIIGPNGAGKSTMMDVITGRVRPTRGSAFFGQNIDLASLSEAEIAAIGIGRKFQRPTVFEAHSVVENLELALGRDKRLWSVLRTRLDSEQADRIAEVMEIVGLASLCDRPAGLLSHGQKQWLEIGMLLIQRARVLLLDEPVAGMTDAETARTAELFNTLKGEHSLIVVEHDMDFVAQVAEGGKVTVLNEGSVLAEGSLEQVRNDERVIEVYLGR